MTDLTLTTRCEVCRAIGLSKGEPADASLVACRLDGTDLVCPVCGYRMSLDEVINGAADALGKATVKQMQAHVKEDRAQHLTCSYDAAVFVLDLLRISAYCVKNRLPKKVLS